MGHELTASGLRSDAEKIEAVQRMPPPVDRNGVLRLLGMTTYLAKFFPSFSEATAALLATKKTEFVWDEARRGTVLHKLKDLLFAAPVLQYYDVTKPVTVQCDASQDGLGAVIMQDENCRIRVTCSIACRAGFVRTNREIIARNRVFSGTFLHVRVRAKDYCSNGSSTVTRYRQEVVDAGP